MINVCFSSGRPSGGSTDFFFLFYYHRHLTISYVVEKLEMFIVNTSIENGGIIGSYKAHFTSYSFFDGSCNTRYLTTARTTMQL